MRALKTGVGPRPLRWSAALVLFAAVAVPICFGWMGATDVYVMEGIVADGAREMVRSGDWAVPRLHGDIYMYKPPLSYWLAALSSRAWYPETAWSLRAPFALCSLLLGLSILWAAGRELGPERGLTCALAALTGGLMVQKLHRAEFDMPLALGVGLATVIACVNLASERPRPRLWWLCYLGLAVGFLAKGAPAPMLFGPGLLLAAVVTGRVRTLLRPAHLAGVALFLLVVSGWIYSVVAAAGWEAFDQPLLEAKSKGFSEWSWATFGLALTKPLLVAALLLPWSIFLPLLLRRSWWRSRPLPERRFALSAAAFLVTGALAFTIVPTTESRYFLPLVASAGILFGMAAHASGRPGRGSRLVDRSLPVLTVVLALAAVAVAFGSWPVGLPMRAVAAAFGAAGLALVLLTRRRRLARGPALLALTIALGHWLVHTAILEPARVEKRSLRAVAEAFRPHLEPAETLWTTPVSGGFHHSGLFFYLGHRVRTVGPQARPGAGSALVLFSDEPAWRPDYVLPVEYTVVERRRQRGIDFVLARSLGAAPPAPALSGGEPTG